MAPTINKLRWLVTHPVFRQRPLNVLAGVARWEWHRASSRPAKFQFEGIELVARPFDGIGRLICYFGEEADVLFSFMKLYLKAGMTYVDVGANIGSHVVVGKRMVGESGKVYAFEAEPETCALLKRNVELNRMKNVVIKNECILDKEGYIAFYVNKDSAKNSLLQDWAPDVERTIYVHGNTLDKLLTNVSKIDLLKIDVEGADFKVLQGAKNLFEDEPPSVVVIEIYDVNSDAVNSREVLQFLQKRKYKIYRFEYNRLHLYEPGQELINLYAVHETAIRSVAQLADLEAVV